MYADIQESEKNGRRADSLLPYAKELREKIGANEISLRETLDIAKKDIMKRLPGDTSTTEMRDTKRPFRLVFLLPGNQMFSVPEKGSVKR